MPELLLELLSEEIPARMQARASEDLTKLVTDGLKAADLGFDKVEALVTPRRLTLIINGLPDKQPDLREERRGPRADAPEKAIAGFLAGNGVTLEQCEKRETPKGVFLFAIVEQKGRDSADVIKDIIEDAMAKLPWPKSMRWADQKVRWVRQLDRILCLFDGKVIPASFGPVTAGNITSGHRFLAPATFSVANATEYKAKLAFAKVMLDREERKKVILDGARKLAASEGFTLLEDNGLLEEVCGLVEWPVPVMGKVDDQFMDIPREVLETSMREAPEVQAIQNRLGIIDEELHRHLRCVSLSYDQTQYLVTGVDEAWCMDMHGAALWGVRLPFAEGWNQVAESSDRYATSGEILKALEFMELKLPVSPDDVKGRYRQLAKKYHPVTCPHLCIHIQS